ncbi:MAG: hypothetical protein FJ290_16840 [Planctomycetes bacterium]|nr:hypothetical protein [Planctomycetota bacterium]
MYAKRWMTVVTAAALWVFSGLCAERALAGSTTPIESANKAIAAAKAAVAAAEKADRTADKAEAAADVAKAAAEAAAKKAEAVANDPKATEKQKEKAKADAEKAQKKADEAKAEADDARQKANAAKEAAQKAIEAAEKAVKDVPGGSSRDNRQEEVDKLKERVKHLAFLHSFAGGEALASLSASGKVAVTIAGTGETIGHVADLTVTNKTTKSVDGYIAPMFLASGADYQPYIVPYAGTISLGPGQTRTVPLNGVCADGHKPPVPKGNSTALSVAPETPQTQALIKGVQDIIMATERLQLTGAIKTPFSSNPAKERDTIIQWTTWTFTSAKSDRPVTKADLAKKVQEQAGATTPEQKAALDKGIDQIWGGVQLTGAKAKVL